MLDGFVVQESKKECVLFVLFLLFVVVWSEEPKQNQGRGLVDRKLVQAPPSPPVILLVTVPGRLFCFGSLVILDVVYRYLSVFLLHVYINIKISKTRTVRKSDYTPALALPKRMAGIFDEKCKEKEK